MSSDDPCIFPPYTKRPAKVIKVVGAALESNQSQDPWRTRRLRCKLSWRSSLAVGWSSRAPNPAISRRRWRPGGDQRDRAKRWRACGPPRSRSHSQRRCCWWVGFVVVARRPACCESEWSLRDVWRETGKLWNDVDLARRPICFVCLLYMQNYCWNMTLIEMALFVRFLLIHTTNWFILRKKSTMYWFVQQRAEHSIYLSSAELCPFVWHKQRDDTLAVLSSFLWCSSTRCSISSLIS